MKQRTSGETYILHTLFTEKELEVGDILLDLEAIVFDSEIRTKFSFQWGDRKRRSAINSTPIPPRLRSSPCLHESNQEEREIDSRTEHPPTTQIQMQTATHQPQEPTCARTQPLPQTLTPRPQPTEASPSGPSTSAPRFTIFDDVELRRRFSELSFLSGGGKDLRELNRLYGAFILPSDDMYTEKVSNGELFLESAFHLGRFLSLYGRNLKREVSGQAGDTRIRRLELQLRDVKLKMQSLLQAYNDLKQRGKRETEELQKQNKRVEDLVEQNKRWEAEAKKNAELASQSVNLQKSLTETLQKLTLTETQLTKAIEEIKQAAWRYKKLDDSHEDLKKEMIKLQEDHSVTKSSLQQFEEANKELHQELQQRQSLQEDNEMLQKELTELKQKLQSEEEKSAKLMEVNRRGQATHKDLQACVNELQNKCNSLKKQQIITEEQKQEIIKEYRASPELTAEIIDQFAQGYQVAKAKVAEAGTDPKSLGFSDDEEAEDDTQRDPQDPPEPTNK